MANDGLDEETRQQDFAAAQAIIESPDVFTLAAEAMARRGYAGDERQVELLYAIFTSRLLPRPMCAFIKAPSSSGKSWLLNRTLELFPEDAYEIKSGFSPKAIAYGRSDLRHKVLAVQEASGLNGREGNMLVRTLISEGHVRWEVAGRTREGFTTRVVVRPGPIAFVMTTTHNTLHREDETRALSILVEDTPRHTRHVLRSIAGRYAGDAASAGFDTAPWHAYQRWLANGPRAVAVPFGEALADRYWAQANRSKRDFEQLMTAVATSALMHQAGRGRDGGGRIVATLDDYAKARRFLHKPINEASGSMVPATVRETVEALIDYGGVRQVQDWRDAPGLTVQELALRLGGIDKGAVSRRVAKAKDLGLVVDLGRGPAFPSRLVVVQPLPDDWDVLPLVEHIEADLERGGGRLQPVNRERDGEGERENPLASATVDADAPVSIAEPDAAAEGAPTSIPSIPSDPGPALTPPAAPPPPVPEIIANAPRPDQPDGGYRGRRAIYAYRAARGCTQT